MDPFFRPFLLTRSVDSIRTLNFKYGILVVNQVFGLCHSFPLSQIQLLKPPQALLALLLP
jgi:hypothetical protein